MLNGYVNWFDDCRWFFFECWVLVKVVKEVLKDDFFERNLDNLDNFEF